MRCLSIGLDEFYRENSERAGMHNIVEGCDSYHGEKSMHIARHMCVLVVFSDYAGAKEELCKSAVTEG